MPQKELISCLNCAKGTCGIDHYSSSEQQVTQTLEGARADDINCSVCSHGTIPLAIDKSSRYCPRCSAIWTPDVTDEKDEENGPTVEQRRQQRHQRQQEQERERERSPPSYSPPSPPKYSLYPPATTSPCALGNPNPNLIPPAQQFRPKPRPAEPQSHAERQTQPRFPVMEMSPMWAELGVYY